MIQINTPAGAPPAPLLHTVITDVFDEIVDAAALAPPQLDCAVALTRAAQERDDVAGVDRHLRKIAHAAVGAIAGNDATREQLVTAFADVAEQVLATAAASAQPPQLHPSLAALDAAASTAVTPRLRDVAHAAIASLVRVRAAREEPTA